MEDLSSPDQLRDHLKVTGMPVWIVMIAVLVLLAGFFVWSAFASFTSYTSVKGIVKGGVLTVVLQEEEISDIADSKMVCRVGDVESDLRVSGMDAEGNRIAAGKVTLPEGTYDVRIGYRQMKAIELLLN